MVVPGRVQATPPCGWTFANIRVLIQTLLSEGLVPSFPFYFLLQSAEASASTLFVLSYTKVSGNIGTCGNMG